MDDGDSGKFRAPPDGGKMFTGGRDENVKSISGKRGHTDVVVR